MIKQELIKPIIHQYSPADSRKLCTLKGLNNKAGEIMLDVKEAPDSYGYRFRTELKNKYGKLLGKEIFSYFKGKNYMTGQYIEVLPEYRQHNYFFGELLRLASIIELLENKLKQIEIYSKNTAVYFHSKYKFKPAIKNFNERDKVLESIIENEMNGYEDLRLRAKVLQNLIKDTDIPENQRKLCEKTSILADEYINRVLKNDEECKKHPFKNGISMLLSYEDIIKNKEYFNKLFQKQGIDYTI